MADLHVGLNLIFMVPDETGGMEVAARELLSALVDEAPSNIRFTAFVNEETRDDELPVEKVVVPVQARNRLRWVQGEQLLLPSLVEKAGCDLLHSLGSTAPARGNFVRVTTVHDLNYKVVPETHFGVRALGMRMLVPLAVRRSQRIIADSKSTKDDLVEHLSVLPEKVDVVHLGYGQEAVPPTPVDKIKQRFQLAGPVLLSLLAKRPHKNLMVLLEALALLDPASRPTIVFAGYSTPYEVELKRRAQELALTDNVRWVDWLDQADVEALYNLSECFVFPSLYEGFGLPVLEAMARGVPVACANAGSLPEIAGDAALLFDPREPQQVADAINMLTHDAEKRQCLRTAGLQRAATFTWEKSAQATLNVYARTLGRELKATSELAS